ncbi:aspartate/glutamate racemase family protein [Solwaraspora sp. WMMD792]|uniref:aspartate/glutamate racemase family protein n=1 Tax=Solwaraspora sp. WMMD792 TaxID=3016099 RepID=UPI0024179646|nr:aspartate/glutamate racemase family protein [Solwaraspora sp. WMMD792]MDG4770311.1 aspartate/glutamate racemase family protein [Solwaraspora sp. WMMD792]
MLPIFAAQHGCGSGSDRQAAQQAVGPDTEIVVRNLRGVPPSAYIAADDLLYSPLLGEVCAGADDGFDAIAVACASDPAVREAKALVDVPVTGPPTTRPTTVTGVDIPTPYRRAKSPHSTERRLPPTPRRNGNRDRELGTFQDGESL